VLFTIILLSALILALVQFLKNDVDEFALRNREFRARQLAETGLAYGVHPQVKNEDRSVLEQKLRDGGQFRVVIASESSRLNINVLLQTGRDYILDNLFEKNWGVPRKRAKAAVEGLKEWVGQQQSQQQSEQQSEQQGDQFQLVRQFQAVEEMSLVQDFAPIMEKQPDWANYFTVWGDGKVDVNSAGEEIIQLIAGITPPQAERFVKYRWGRDGKPYTQDDQVYRNLEEVRGALGMGQQQFQLIQELLALNSAIDRIESKGIIAGYEKTITVIASRNTVPIRYLLWQER
jgi:hypothetical protein